MRIVISGTRDLMPTIAEREIDGYLQMLLGRVPGGIEVCSGESGTVDLAARTICHALGVPFHPFPADWMKFGKGAGFIRNAEMASWAIQGRRSELFALWDGASKGTADMILRAHRAGFDQVCSKVIR